MSRWSCPNRTTLKVWGSLEGAVEGGWQVTREEARRREGLDTARPWGIECIQHIPCQS